MERLDTLSDLLHSAGCGYRVFDLGRQVAKVDKSTFRRFEQCELPWPLPLRQHAWFAIAFWQPARQGEPFVWFLHLPLDERGLLMPVARDHFLKQVVTVLGSGGVTLPDSGGVTLPDSAQQESLARNPFIRKPAQGRLALFHSLLRQALGLPPSEHHGPACRWLSEPQQHDWREVGLQGIADVLVRGERQQLAQLAALIEALPDEAVQLLSPLLEFVPLAAGLDQALEARLSQAQAAGDRATVLACVRALGLSSREQTTQQLERLLAEPLRQDLEYLATLAARHWLQLKQSAALRQDYLNALAEHDQQETLFPGMVRELMSLQPLQRAMQESLHSEQLAPAAQQAVAALVGRVLH